MKLAEICEELTYTCLQGEMEKEISDIIYDSRKVEKDTIFLLISYFSPNVLFRCSDNVACINFRFKYRMGRSGHKHMSAFFLPLNIERSANLLYRYFPV